MPRDVLGFDPYQLAAIRAVRLLLALFVVLVVTAVSLIPASAAQKDVELGEQMRTGAGVLACGAVASLVCAQLRLQKESLAWSDLC